MTGRMEATRCQGAPVLLVAALIFTTVMAVPGQSGKQKRPRAAGQTQGAFNASAASKDITQPRDSGEDESKLTVVRRVTQVRVSASTAKAIRSIAGLRGVVAVRAGTVRALAGSSIWLLSNGGYAIVETTAEPEPNAMEVFRKNMGLCDERGNCWWYFAMCYCLNGDPNNDPSNFGAAMQRVGTVAAELVVRSRTDSLTRTGLLRSFRDKRRQATPNSENHLRVASKVDDNIRANPAPVEWVVRRAIGLITRYLSKTHL
jgi:hypothetical protein